jgi:hypothetical protein
VGNMPKIFKFRKGELSKDLGIRNFDIMSWVIHNMFSFPRNMASWTIDPHNCKGPFGESFSNFVFTSTYKKLSLTYFIKHGTHHYFLPHVWNLILLHFSFCLMGLTSNSSSHFEDLVYILIN